MAGARQVGRFSGGIDGHLNGPRAIVGGDAGGHAHARVDGLAECGAVLRSVLGAHGTDVQVFEALLGHGEADQAATILGHEVDGFGRNLLGRQRDVAFVLAVFVVDHDNHAAGANFLDRGGDVGEGLGGHGYIIVAVAKGTMEVLPACDREGSGSPRRFHEGSSPTFPGTSGALLKFTLAVCSL